mgnify:CR=1 FL=1
MDGLYVGPICTEAPWSCLWNDVDTDAWQDSTHRHVLAFMGVAVKTTASRPRCPSQLDAIVGQPNIIRNILQFACTTDPNEYECRAAA